MSLSGGRALAFFNVEAENFLRAATAEIKTRMARAITLGITAGTEHAKTSLRNQILSAYQSKRFANAIGSKVFPDKRASVSATGTVFGRGDGADTILRAHSTGAVILPRKGRYLAIPLHNYRGPHGRLTPKEWFGARLVLVPFGPKSRGRGRAAMLATKLPPDAIGKKGKVRSRLLRTVSTKSRKALTIAAGGRYVPQFLLLRSVRLKKKIFPEAVIPGAYDVMLTTLEREFSRAERG